METKIAKPKTKKQIIADFLKTSVETDVKKAFQDYIESGISKDLIASEGLFKFVWAKLYGTRVKVDKTKTNNESVRQTISEMYKEQEKLMQPVRENRIKALLTDDQNEKKQFFKAAETALDLVANQNRAIRDFMEKNSY